MEGEEGGTGWMDCKECNSRAAASLSAQDCFSSSSSFSFCSLLEIWSSSSLACASCSSDFVCVRAAWASDRTLLVWVREAWVQVSSAWVLARLLWVSERDVWRFDWTLLASSSHRDLRAWQTKQAKERMTHYKYTIRFYQPFKLKNYSDQMQHLYDNFCKAWPLSLWPASPSWRLPEQYESPTAASTHLNRYNKNESVHPRQRIWRLHLFFTSFQWLRMTHPHTQWCTCWVHPMVNVVKRKHWLKKKTKKKTEEHSSLNSPMSRWCRSFSLSCCSWFSCLIWLSSDWCWACRSALSWANVSLKEAWTWVRAESWSHCRLTWECSNWDMWTLVRLRRKASSSRVFCA